MKIICTLGPACEAPEKLNDLKKAGVDIFRINMSHAALKDIQKYYEIGQKLGIKIALDTEGAQIRTNLCPDINDVNVKVGEIVLIGESTGLQDNKKLQSISLSPENVISKLMVGDVIRIDFNGLVVVLKEKVNKGYFCECISAGSAGKNKGVDILNREIELDDFTPKDISALKIANDLGIRDIFISFCKSVQAIQFARKIVNEATIVSKIESRASIHALHAICSESDGILIDRGDLSRELSILDIPFAQRGIIQTARKLDTPCYVATNVLESLIDGELPTRAELNDIVSTLEMGAAGIVLAAETAIGNKPILCAEIVRELMHKYTLSRSSLLFADLDRNEITDPTMKLWLNRNR
ncbi:hypothetical protein KR100_01415 [Synechococcus sp. KORDI-100]|uniref:pyruvate kinase n=1 Tax=Synechococcus sp. KORDI-100 TaxID=1280380 RepID=UPI0004E08103|nr:pyruvate kinase [Synechococcus sp. KORDI-100]AII42065.1 hypothetical protein KR100_01415 [Synechococcus sp. KORDI-100]